MRCSWWVVLVLALPAALHAADDDLQEVTQDLGAVLGWRLFPVVLEEGCRSVDPAGNAKRAAGLKAWLAKNDARIKEIDARVAELAPYVVPADLKGTANDAVRAQVERAVRDTLTGGKSPDEFAARCKAEADPARPHWHGNGMPLVAQALAAMYDWKTRQDAAAR